MNMINEIFHNLVGQSSGTQFLTFYLNSSKKCMDFK